MKKWAIIAAGTALVLSAVPALAKVERVAGSWELIAPSPIVFTCGGGTYPHTLDDVSSVAGSFTGVGTYDVSSSYTWDIDGEITGDDIIFTLVYTGTGAGYTLNGEGTIGSDGSVSGTTDGNCQTFSMGAGSATATFEGNHGQWVKMSEDKKGAAHSRVGMPVQSKGHAKE
jgi:hypothetical protein